jgi:radical SAM superfamily enzyme YgiQ (UPF0313 family)
MVEDSIFLISPPGWALNLGGPHIALPLLQGFLTSKNIPCTIVDLNIEVTRYFDIKITEKDVITANKNLSIDNMNRRWFLTQNKMKKIAGEFHGDWNILNGFNYSKCNLASSNDIRNFSYNVSPFTKYYKEILIPKIIRGNYPLIGISVVIPTQLLASFEIVRLIREAGYDGVVVLGGNTPTRLISEMSHDWIYDIFDGIIIYQGEEALVSLWNAIKSGRGYDQIPNFVYRIGKTIRQNKLKYLSKKEFQPPNFDNLPIGKYWGTNVLPALGSRGCYHRRCEFCSIPYAWGETRFLGSEDPLKIIDFIRTCVSKYQINRFSFVEESIHPIFFKSFVNYISDTGLQIGFEGYARLDRFWIDKKLLKSAQQVGLKKLFFGLELLDPLNRSSMKKADSINQIIPLLESLKESGIKTHLFCMVGYPGTTLQNAMETIDFILKYRDFIDTIDVSPFQYAKHTKVEKAVPKLRKMNDWTLFYDYKVKNSELKNNKFVFALSNKLEEIVWQEKPEWLHPIYRLYSPWH